MKTYKQIKFKDLPRVCRVWIIPKAGPTKGLYVLCVKNGDEARVEDTNQIFYPSKNSVTLKQNDFDTDTFFQSLIIKQTVMPTTKAKTAKKKVAKKAAKKKSNAGRKANAESMASKIVALHIAGKDNAEIAEKLGCTNKYVCDVTWRHNNPSEKKKDK